MFARAENTDDDLAMAELEVTAVRDSLIACHADRADQIGHCDERDRDGDRLRQFDSRLVDDPLGQAMAVQRM